MPTQMNIVSVSVALIVKLIVVLKKYYLNAEAHPNSPLAERYGRKSVKQTQVESEKKTYEP